VYVIEHRLWKKTLKVHTPASTMRNWRKVTEPGWRHEALEIPGQNLVYRERPGLSPGRTSA